MSIQCNYSKYEGLEGYGIFKAERTGWTGREEARPECASAREDVQGLSTAHISPLTTQLRNLLRYENPKLEVWRGASRVKVSHGKFRKVISQKSTTDVRRSNITQFSRQSRKRLLDLLGSIDKEQKPIFVTLTYPGEFTTDSRQWKRDLDNFFKRMRRKAPGSSAIWKLEPQKRGAPHFHLFIWGLSYDALFLWVRKAWYEVVGSGDYRHYQAGTRVEKIKSWRGIRSYASKYMGKIFDSPTMQDCGWDQPGRFWGVHGRKYLPCVIATVLEIMSDRQVFELLRYFRKYSGIKARKYQSLSIIVNNPERWEKLLE